MDGFDAATYGDRFADVYDDWYPADPDTEACVTRLAEVGARRAGTAILELAVGTGRVALPLAARGLDVRGTDASAAMLARLRAKDPEESVVTDVGELARPVLPWRPTDPPGGPPVGLVYVTSNTLFALPGPTSRAAAFEAVAALLAPADGFFAFEVFVPPDEHAHPSLDSAVTIRTLTADRVVLSAATRDRSRRTISGQFIDITDGDVRLRPYHLHYAFPADLDAELAAAGFGLVERTADWSGTPFTPDAASQVSVYQRR